MEKECNNSNLLIKAAVRRTMPAGGLSIVALCIASMIDYFFAGIFYTPVHIASIGIASPVHLMAYSIISIIGSGAVLEMLRYIGRGDKEQVNRYYTVIYQIMAVCAIVAIIVIFIFTRQIVILFGARQEELVILSTQYLRSYLPCILFGTLVLSLNSVLSAYGYNKEVVIEIVIQIFTNIFFSYILMKYTALGFAALGCGTAISYVFSVLFALTFIKLKIKDLKIHFSHYSMKTFLHIFVRGIPQAGDTLVQSFASGIINNIIILNLGVNSLALYTIALNVFNFAAWGMGGCIRNMTALYGILAGANDRIGFRTAVKSSFLYGYIYTAIWTVVIILLMPVLMMLFGINDNPEISSEMVSSGVYFFMLSLPFEFVSNQMSFIFDAVAREKKATLCMILPDSVIYPILLYIMLNLFGISGMWFSFALSFITFLGLYYAYVCIKHKKFVHSADDYFDLAECIHEDIPSMDVSIKSDNEKIEGISERFQTFLIKEGISEEKAYMTALCLEELAVDMRDNCKKKNGYMDIKLFANKTEVSVIVRDSSAAYNPLDFEVSMTDFDKMGVAMVQKLSKSIEYKYVYKMNVVRFCL